jgi:nucleoporin GLE1
MPARASDHDSLPSLLLRSHISNASSVEDLSETEAIHRDALAAAQAEHQRVRESALRAYKNNELKEARERLLRLQVQEVERLKLEAERAELAARVQELQRKTIPLPAPREPAPTPPPAPKPAEVKREAPARVRNDHTALAAPQDGVSSRPSQSIAQPRPEPNLRRSAAATAPTAPTAPRIQSIQSSQISQKQTPIAAPSPQATSQTVALSGGVPAPSTNSQPIYPGAEEYVEIHKRLKQVRAYTMDFAKKDPALKKKVGEMRREIRKSVGQLTEGKGANKTPVSLYFTYSMCILIL